VNTPCVPILIGRQLPLSVHVQSLHRTPWYANCNAIAVIVEVDVGSHTELATLVIAVDFVLKFFNVDNYTREQDRLT